MEQGENLRAMALLTATFESIEDNYENIYDSSGDVAEVASKCVRMMRKIVQEVDWDAETRQEWQKRMFQCFINDDYDLADEVDELILDSCRQEDVAWLTSLAQDELKKLQSQRAEEFFVQYQRKLIIQFLSTLHRRFGKVEDRLEILREHGLHLDYAKALAENELLKEAVNYAKEWMQGQDVVEFAFWLMAEAKKPNEAAEFLEFILANKPQAVNWSETMQLLARAKELLNDLKGAREVLRRLYSKKATLPIIKDIHRLSQTLGDWEEVREWALSETEKQNIDLSERIRVYLFLSDWEKAIKVTQKLLNQSPKIYLPIQLVEEVAKAVAPHRPEEAISLLQIDAEGYIDKGNREAYRHAASLLKEAKELAEQIDPAAFQRYIDSLRERHKKRRALLEELSGL